MWTAFRILRMLAKSFATIAASLSDIRDLYRLDLASRGVIQINPTIKDEVEVAYGYHEPEEE